MFVPRLDTASSGGGGPTSEPPEVVLPFVRLTMISYSDYYGCWVARLHNLGNKDDSALLIDSPLPKTSRFQTEKKEWDRKKARERVQPKRKDAKDAKEEKPPEEPVQRWVVKDRFKGKLMEIQAARIEPLRVIVQVDDKFYALNLGDNVQDAMQTTDEEGKVTDHALDKKALQKLGLTADPTEVVKQVRLTRLSFNRDRKGWEAAFVNPLHKDEKKVLANDVLPEEFDAPEEWSVRDRFSSEVMKIKVVRVEKDRVLFVADKKVYAMRPNETLSDVLARPLTDAEVK